jgi:hypothetical protein
MWRSGCEFWQVVVGAEAERARVVVAETRRRVFVGRCMMACNVMGGGIVWFEEELEF